MLRTLACGLLGATVLTACAAPQTSGQKGIASWYGSRFQGRATASGEHFNSAAMTAAHPSLPFGTRIRVTNLDNGRAAVLRINDRGPNKAGRILDVSRRAAEVLGFRKKGLTRVRIDVIGP